MSTIRQKRIRKRMKKRELKGKKILERLSPLQQTDLHKYSKEWDAFMAYPCSMVYVIRCNDYFKIGHTDRISPRLEGLQMGNPYKLELVFLFTTEKRKELEKILHNEFAQTRIRGEWFKLSSEDLDKLPLLVLEVMKNEQKK